MINDLSNQFVHMLISPILRFEFQVISASVDGSVRLWYRRTGHFLGYFGQYSAFFRPKTPQLMKILTSDVPPVLPSDIQGRERLLLVKENYAIIAIGPLDC